MKGPRFSAVLLLLALFATAPPARAYTLQYRDATGLVARRWLSKPIIIAFSTSLSAPPPNIKAGSDIIGATRRALQHWASVADIQFLRSEEHTSELQSQSNLVCRLLLE